MKTEIIIRGVLDLTPGDVAELRGLEPVDVCMVLLRNGGIVGADIRELLEGKKR